MPAVDPVKGTIALVAHDSCKPGLVEWAEYDREVLAEHRLVATGTTGSILQHELGLPVTQMQSGPLGGDLRGSYGRQRPDHRGHLERLTGSA